jgi:fumarate reductase flavoprotein subunit
MQEEMALADGRMNVYDMIVVGAGTAGIPCAVAAAQCGASVLLVDKAAEIGGALHLSTAQMSAGGSRRQAAKGLIDSPDQHYEDVLRINRGSGRHDLIRLAVDEAPATVDFFEEQGIDWDPDCPKVLYFHEAYNVARTVWGRRGGHSLLDILRRELTAWVRPGAIELWLEGDVQQLLTGDDGSVAGVELHRGGAVQQVNAAAVVLATGGYGANPELFAELHDRPLYSVAWPTSTGDGISLATQVGGQIVGADTWLPTFGGLPGPEEDWKVAWQDRSRNWAAQLREQWELYVLRDGRRFVAEDDEHIDNKERALSAVPDLTFFQIFDTRVLKEGPEIFSFCSNDELPTLAGKRRGVFSGDSLRGLAAEAGIDADRLEATVRDYNRAVASGSGDELGRRFLPVPIDEPPFFAVQNHGISVISFGGVDVDGELRVRRDGGEVVAGLYAVGEVLGAGAVSGNAFCGGMLVTPAISLGRWLGSRLGAAAKRD